MPHSIPVLCLAFANDHEPTSYLRNLNVELRTLSYCQTNSSLLGVQDSGGGSEPNVHR